MHVYTYLPVYICICCTSGSWTLGKGRGQNALGIVPSSTTWPPRPVALRSPLCSCPSSPFPVLVFLLWGFGFGCKLKSHRKSRHLILHNHGNDGSRKHDYNLIYLHRAFKGHAWATHCQSLRFPNPPDPHSSSPAAPARSACTLCFGLGQQF